MHNQHILHHYYMYYMIITWIFHVSFWLQKNDPFLFFSQPAWSIFTRTLSVTRSRPSTWMVAAFYPVLGVETAKIMLRQPKYGQFMGSILWLTWCAIWWRAQWTRLLPVQTATSVSLSIPEPSWRVQCFLCTKASTQTARVVLTSRSLCWRSQAGATPRTTSLCSGRRKSRRNKQR